MRRAFLEHAGLVWLAALVPWLGGCRRTAAAAPASVQDRGPELVQHQQDGFWWAEMGEQSAAVASFGPTLEKPEGRFRPWSLVIFLPGSEEPLSCFQGLVDLDAATPIMAKGGSFGVELAPCDGCTWIEVTDDTRLVTQAEGIY